MMSHNDDRSTYGTVDYGYRSEEDRYEEDLYDLDEDSEDADISKTERTDTAGPSSELEQDKKALDQIMRELSVLRHSDQQKENAARMRTLENAAASLVNKNSEVIKASARSKIYGNNKYLEDELDDMILETLFKCLNEYDHLKSDSFYAYFVHYLKEYTVGDALREYAEMRKNVEKSLDDPDQADEGISDRSYERNEMIERFNGRFYNVIACVAMIKTHSKKKDSYRYYRAFASEKFIALCKLHDHREFDINENDAFNAMDIDFNDLVLTANCDTFNEIKICPFKTYLQAEISDENIEISIERNNTVGFEGRVYKKYFGCSDALVSRKRKEFEEYITIPTE